MEGSVGMLVKHGQILGPAWAVLSRAAISSSSSLVRGRLLPWGHAEGYCSFPLVHTTLSGHPPQGAVLHFCHWNMDCVHGEGQQGIRPSRQEATELCWPASHGSHGKHIKAEFKSALRIWLVTRHGIFITTDALKTSPQALGLLLPYVQQRLTWRHP